MPKQSLLFRLRKYFLCIIMLCIVAPSPAPALTPAAILTPSQDTQADPNLVGGKIIYRSRETGFYNVYESNILTGTSTPLTNYTSFGFLRNVRAKGNLVAWLRGSVYVLDRLSGEIHDTQESGDNLQTDGSYVVFENSGDIFMYTPASRNMAALTGDGTDTIQRNPTVGSGYVAWLEDDGSINAYNISNPGIQKVFSNTSLATVSFLQISGNKLYWVDNRTGNDHIYAFTLGNAPDTEVQLSANSAYTMNDLFIEATGKYAAFSTTIPDSGIRILNLATGNLDKLADSGYNPSVEGELVTWEDGADIFYTDLIPPVVTANPGARLFNAPLQVTLTANEPADIFVSVYGTEPVVDAVYQYTGPLTLSQSTTLKFFARDPAGNKGATITQEYIFDGTPPVVLANLSANTQYNSPQSLVLSINESGTIYFTTNGTEPVVEAVYRYTGPLNINTTTTVKFFAFDSAGNKSATETLPITIRPPTPVAEPNPGTNPGVSPPTKLKLIDTSKLPPQPVTPFMDTAGHWAGPAIGELQRLGLLKGDGKNLYRPDTPVTRGELATLLSRLLDAKPGQNYPFKDTVPAWARDGVSTLAALGIVQGYGDGTFRPNQPVNRAEAAVIVGKTLRLLWLSPPAGSKPVFADKDIFPGWTQADINLLADYGLITGFEDGSYRPNTHTNRAEAAVLIWRLLERTRQAG